MELSERERLKTLDVSSPYRLDTQIHIATNRKALASSSGPGGRPPRCSVPRSLAWRTPVCVAVAVVVGVVVVVMMSVLHHHVVIFII